MVAADTPVSALWVGLFFHLTISLMTPVQLFTAEMLLVYLLFATPDVCARVLRFDPSRHAAVGGFVGALDWLRRYKVEPAPGSVLVVVDRDGRQRRGIHAYATLFATLPVVFPLWPLAAAVSRLVRRQGASPDDSVAATRG